MKHKLAIGVLTRSTIETSWNLLHRMDRSHKTLQLKMINFRTDEVYTNAKLVIITLFNARLNQYLVAKI